MPNNRLILRKLVSPWVTPVQDLTKGTVLTHDDLDNNLIYLRGEHIYTAQTQGNNLIFNKINGNNLSIDLTSIAASFTGGTITGDTIFTSDVYMTSALTVNNLTVTGNSVFTSAVTINNLTVTGDSVFNGDVYITSALTINNLTVTGDSVFNGDVYMTSALTVNNLTVTGDSVFNGDVIFTSAVTMNNLTVTGDATFNTISATTYLNLPPSYDAGPITTTSGWSSTGSGQINLPQLDVALYDNVDNLGLTEVYTVASGTSGVGSIPALTDNDTNYVVVEYNGGSPRYNVYNNDGVVDDSSVVLVYTIYRLGNFIHVLEYGNFGAGLPNKINDRIKSTDRFGWESGLMIGLSGATGVVTVSAGVAWNGVNKQTLNALNSQDDIFFKNYHVGGSWAYTTTGNTLNNTYYDNGTDLVSATTGNYLVNYYYRGQELNDHLYEVYGNGEYASSAQAEAADAPVLPELITSHTFLVGRIVVKVGETTGLTQTAFGTVFQSTGTAPASGIHNNLSGLQGGVGGQYYHLTSSEYNNLAYTNTDNTFTNNVIFNGGLSACTSGITTNDIYSCASGVTVHSNFTFIGQANNPLHHNGNGNTFTLDWNNSNIQTITLTGNTSIANPINVKEGASYQLIIKQGVGGPYTINSWGSNFKWEDGTYPALSTGTTNVDIITFITDDNGFLYGIGAFNFY